jgi:MFS family permease
MIMSADNPTPGQHRGLVLGAMTLANAMVLVAFAGASACAAFAPTFGLLILCRAVQGAGGALMLRYPL